MPKRIELVDDGYSSTGITVVWTKSASRIDIYGWYDQIVGIKGKQFLLAEFFDALGITERDCKKAFAAMRKGVANG